MHRLAALLTTAMVLGAASIAAPEILSNRLIEHIKVLSSDEMKGRGNGGPELDRAADYIKNQFKAAGLQPGWKGAVDPAVRADRRVDHRAARTRCRSTRAASRSS